MKSRLAALGVPGVVGAHVPLGGARAAPPLRARVGREDPADQGARCSGRSRTRCRRRTSSGRRATSRPRSSGRRRSGSGPTATVASSATHEPPIPADLMARGLPRVRAAQGGARRDRLRGPARARDPAARGRRAGARDVPRALPRVHRRRVPGRQPAPADAARALARRPRRPLRRRRRLPVDLRLHRRLAALAARGRGAVPARRRSSGSRATTARRRRCSSSRTGSCRCSSGAEKVLRPTRPVGPGAGGAAASRPPRTRTRWIAAEVEAARGGGHRRSRRWRCSRRTNARLADFEEVFHDAGHPVPGLVAARARRGAADAAAARARRLDRRRGARADARRGGRAALRRCPTSSASAS